MPTQKIVVGKLAAMAKASCASIFDQEGPLETSTISQESMEKNSASAFTQLNASNPFQRVLISVIR